MTSASSRAQGEGRSRSRRRLIHLTTIDLSLSALLLPQLVAFRDAGYEVIGVSAAGPSVDHLRAAGIEHVPLRHSTRAGALHRDAAAAWEFARVCRRLRPDIVHTHNPKPGVYGRIAARVTGVPVVVNTVHGLYALPEDPVGKRFAVYGLERLAAAFSDAELLQNEEDLPILRQLGIPARRLYVLGNGIDLARFRREIWPWDERNRVRKELAIERDEFVVGAVGRLVAEKGYRELFAALRKVAQRGRRITCIVIGGEDPAKRDALTAEELAVAKAHGIRMLGWRDDIERYYLAMDLYVLASYREGFPRAAMEAAAMGLPIVASDVRGCRQVVEDEETGLLVPVRSADSLAAAIERLAADPHLLAEMGAAAARRAQRDFNVHRQIDLTLAVYAQALQRRGVTSPQDSAP